MRSAIAIVLAACACAPASPPQDAFMASLKRHCGKAYEGRLVSTDEADREIAAQRLVMDVRRCAAGEVRIPFHVGDNRSRTWVVTRTAAGLRLKHDHRHEDGSEDALTRYGGDTVEEGTPQRQEFPVDSYSVELFLREGLPQSISNVWAMEIADETFAYELRRENRFFRVEFDLAAPVAKPPAPWGENEGSR